MNISSGRALPARSTRSPGAGRSPGASRRTRSPTTARSIGSSASSTPAVRLDPDAWRRVPGLVAAGRPAAPRPGTSAGSRELGRALVQRIAVAAEPLRQQRVHQSAERLVRAAEAGQVLDVEDESPRLPGVRIAAHRCGRTPGAREQIESPVGGADPARPAGAAAPARRTPRPRSGSSGARMMRRLATMPDQLVVEQRLAARHEAGNAGLDQAGSRAAARCGGTDRARRSRPSRVPRPPDRAAGRPPATRPRTLRRRRRCAATQCSDSRSASSRFSNSPGLRVTSRRAVSKICREQRRFRSSTIGLAMLEVVPEALQDGGVGAGPGEDGLLVVAHGEAVAVSARRAR